MSSSVLALQALHSNFLADNRTNQSEVFVNVLDTIADYTGFAGVRIVTGMIAKYLCELQGDFERK